MLSLDEGQSQSICSVFLKCCHVLKVMTASATLLFLGAWFFHLFTPLLAQLT